jgi:hypothetical protein
LVVERSDAESGSEVRVIGHILLDAFPHLFIRSVRETKKVAKLDGLGCTQGVHG